MMNRAERRYEVLSEFDPLVQARNEASSIVFKGLAQYVVDVEPTFEGETRKHYEWAAGRRCGHPQEFESEGQCRLCGFCYHRRIMREDPGSRNELQYCLICGEEKTRVWRDDDEDGYPTYRGF